jgi:hypothetical protein
MNRYVYEQEMKTPTHMRKTRMVDVETEIRMGNTPTTTATVTRIEANMNTAMKSQPMATPTAASATVTLLGLVDDRGLMGCR